MSPLVRTLELRCTLPLATTMVCIDCEMLFAGRVPACPACGSGSWWPLARWLNRKKVAV